MTFGLHIPVQGVVELYDNELKVVLVTQTG